LRSIPEEMGAKVMAAAELFGTQGLDRSTMEDIAAATGVPKATLYYYFAGKEEILAFLFHRLLAEVHGAVTSAVSGPGTAAARLRGVIRSHLEVFQRHPMASRAMQFDLGRAARVPEIAAQADTAFIEPVRKLLAEGVADGSLRPVEHPRLTATTLLGAITTAGINALTMDGARLPVDAVAEVVAGVLLDGLRPGHPERFDEGERS
jgi:TetR/AcrR family transcriptional regulator